jgi:hypothetical protein
LQGLDVNAVLMQCGPGRPVPFIFAKTLVREG